MHPQKTNELLINAQEKLKKRLLANFGRHPSIGDALNGLKTSWNNMREISNRSLSKSLTQSIQEIWPESEIRIELPKTIEELIQISDISLTTSKLMPIIELSNQGTGAQSTVLYEINYMLDSDKTLHKGLYYALWLIEEPESFMHGDLCIKLGQMLNSKNWLSNIQMINTTHNGYILGSTSNSSELINMALIDNTKVLKSKKITDWDNEEIKEIGKNLGDSYFYILFHILSNNKRIFIEDTRKETAEALRKCSINVYKALNGVTEIKKYIEVITGLGSDLPENIYFLIDADNGKDQVDNLLKEAIENKQYSSGIEKIILANKIIIVLLPNGKAFEDLYSEYELFLEKKVKILFGKNNNYENASIGNIPASLTRVHSIIRSKKNCLGMEGAKNLIRKHQDIKDQFWAEVKRKKYLIENKYVIDISDAVK